MDGLNYTMAMVPVITIIVMELVDLLEYYLTVTSLLER